MTPHGVQSCSVFSDLSDGFKFKNSGTLTGLLLLPIKVPTSPSTTSWATFMPGPIEELQAINRSCSPWVVTRADPTLPAPRNTWRTSDSITWYRKMEREDGGQVTWCKIIRLTDRELCKSNKNKKIRRRIEQYVLQFNLGGDLVI